MAKYTRDLSEDLVKKVQTISSKFGLKENGIKVEAIRLNKGKVYGEVLKSNELVKLFTGDEEIIVVALYEEVLESMNDEAQNILINNLLEQIVYQEDKEGNLKIRIEKPQLNIGLNTYRKYGESAMEVLETVLIGLEQAAEIERERKAAKKGRKE